VTVTAKASNVGARAGAETVFLFVRDRVACVARPTLALKGFTRIALKPGARGTVRFELKADDLVFLDADLTPVFEPGDVDIYLGPSADPARLGKATLTLVAPAKRKRAARR
jgi:beta-glucosidase